MAVNVILYDAKRRKIARAVTSREEYISLRDSAQNRSAEKKKMVQMNYCLVSPSGDKGDFPLRGASTVGNSVGMDIDLTADVAEKEKQTQEIGNLILSKRDELGLLMLERSATKGYHIAFRRHADNTREQSRSEQTEKIAFHTSTPILMNNATAIMNMTLTPSWIASNTARIELMS